MAVIEAVTTEGALGLTPRILPSGNWRVERFVVQQPPAPKARRAATAWYLPYTQVHPQTVAGAPKDAVWVNVSVSETAYFEALKAIWARRETFALLEHDVVCRPDVVRAFEECPEPWCAFGYSDICHPECMEAWANTLGCTRFREEILDLVPDALSSIPDGERGWLNLCDRIGERLRAAGFTHHWHHPPVEHHHFGRHECA